MRSDVRLTFATAAVVATAAVLIAAEVRMGQPPAGLTVHEWGTFTSVAGEDGNAVEWGVLDGKDDLPRFVIDGGYHCIKNRLMGTIRMETPVLYFYSQRPVEARVHVSLSQGTLTEWYPQADRNSGLEWRNLKIEPGTTPAYPVEAAASRYYAARATDAAPVTAGRQHEKFLFYRGVGHASVPLSARLSADSKVVVANRGADTVPMMMLFENRGGRIGYTPAGALTDSVTLDRPPLEATVGQLRSDLEAALIAQGLYPKEAQAMLETWRDSWFEEGARLIYIVPARTVNTMVPLEVEPAPSQTARVFVGRIELITPETVSAVEKAYLANDRSIGERYGRFLEPILNRIAMRDLNQATALYRFRAGIPFSGGCR
jgi:hypothetical protein